MALSGCRVLPPLPGTPSDEAILAHLETLSWQTSRLPKTFDSHAVPDWFGQGVFPEDLWRVWPRDRYMAQHGDESAGVRKLWKFYVAETDPVSGISIFVHEYAHAANWIDVFDMPYNELLSIALECHIAVLAVRNDPDLAAVLLMRALALYRERDAHYEEEGHMRARLWLGALLEDREPLEIYRWARDAGKAEFRREVEARLGISPYDVMRRGVTAFVQRHFPGDYLSTVISQRDRQDPQRRLALFDNLLESTPEGHVYHDNVQWQRLRCLAELERYGDVLRIGEALWPLTQKSLLAPAVAETTYAAASHLADDTAMLLWQDRADRLTRWRGGELEWQWRRLQIKHNSGKIGILETLARGEQLRAEPYWKHHVDLHKTVETWICDVLTQEAIAMANRWEQDEPEYEAEEKLEALYGYAQLWDHKEFSSRHASLQRLLLSRRGDQAFSLGEYEKAHRFYRQAGQGRHQQEVEFWKNRIP